MRVELVCMQYNRSDSQALPWCFFLIILGMPRHYVLMFFGIASLALILVCSYFFCSDKIVLTKRRVCSVTFLIKKLTRSNVYINVRFSYKRVRISYKKVRKSKFEFINIPKLVKWNAHIPSPFYCSPLLR